MADDAAQPPIATLHRTEGAPPGLPESVPFGAQSTVVSMGRLESNQVALNDRKISKVHCRLIVRTCKRKGTTDGEIMTRIFIKDQSTFGTFVNGKALAKEQWTMLQEDDVIGLRNPHGNPCLGEYSVKYSGGGEAGEAPPAEAPRAAPAVPAQPPAGLMAVKQEVTAAAPSAPPAAAPAVAPAVAPPAAAPPAGLMAVKQEVTTAGTATAPPAEPERPSLQAVKEELAASAPTQHQKVQLPRPPVPAEERPVDPRQQMKAEPGQEQPPERPRARLPAPLPTPRPAAPAAQAPVAEAAEKDDDMAFSPLSEEEGGGEQQGDAPAEPLSPLSEISEVSADDGAAPPPVMMPPAFPMIPGMPTMPGMPMPGMGLPGMPGMPGMPGLGMPGLPPGMNPLAAAALLAGLRPGMPPMPPGVAALLGGGMLSGLGAIPRPPPPAGLEVKTETALAVPGAPPPSGLVKAKMETPEAPKPLVINVQQELIGMLIGKGGETVKQLSKDSGARIEISKTATADGKDSEQRCVYLSGSEEAVSKAKSMIEETLNKARENKGKSDNPNACTMRVPHELIGMLIGKGGETIKELKKESGARVDISKEATAGEDENDRLVHISGPPECVEFAKNMVEEMLGRARERSGGLPLRGRSGSRSPRRASSPGRALAVQGGSTTQTTVKVEHALVGMLIGKGGETIKNISADSGCRIEIAKDEAAEREEKRSVFLSGPPECIKKARDMIEDVMSASREARAEGGGRRGSRSRSRGKGRRSRSRSRGGRPGGRGRTILVPQDAIGMLIGKGGETIRGISEGTGARIEINKEDTTSADRRVILSGSPEQIDKAHDRIDDILQEYRDRLGRADRAGGRNRSPPGRALALRNENDYNDGSDRRAQSPVKDTWLNEKIYIDEVEMPHRPNFVPEHEDGLPSDLEIFVRGLPRVCTERDLWEHLYRLGATDVKEILLLRRQKQSKGMAYVVFNRHDHAMMAKHKLSNSPASAIPCGGQMPAEEKGLVHVRFSESERCINGRNNVYNADMVNLLLGHRGRSMPQVKDESGLRKVLITGRNMKSFGQVDEDPRLHLVVYYEPDEVERVSKAIDIWGEQLGRIHLEMMEMVKGKGKGKMDMMHFPPPMMHFPPPGMPPMGMPPPQARPPFPGDDSAGSVESPVLLQRRKLAPAVEGEAPKMAGPKVLEATCLRGRELRWQPWPEVAQFNEDWHALPMRWGLRGELFVLLRKRETGETRVCAAEVSLPLEKWPVLNASHTGPRTAKYKSFIFNEHLFLICLDRESGSLKVFHVPDPSSAWDVAFETSLPEVADLSPEGFGASRRAKLSVLYAQDRSPHVVVVEPGGPVGAQLFKIVDPAKPWVRKAETPPLSSKARVLPVYTKTSRGTPGDFEASIFSIDGATNELSIYRVPVDTDKPWMLVSKLPFAGDTRLCCVYVPGKPEPLLMAGSPTERLQKLCHLNLIEWTASKLDERAPPPKAPIVEEKFSRQMASLWPESRDGSDAQMVVATPIDCTADMPVSKHAWVTMPLLHGGELERPGPPGAPPGAPRPPFGRSPFEDPWGAFRPPFDPHGPPPYGMRPPFDPHGPPPPFGQPPFDKGMGKGGPPPPGFDPHRPPFDPLHPGGPPPGFERPPFDAGHPPRPPFDMPPMGMPPFERPPLGRPPFDAPPGARPPFDAPPGEWFGGKGGMRPPFDTPMRPPAPGAADGQPPSGPLEAGSFVEADFQEKGQFRRAKILAKHEDGTFDIEYDGDYVEWKVPQSRIRIGQPGAPPPGAPPPGAPPGGEAPKERRRHRHRRGEGEEAAEGGERRHHRHRRRRAEGDEDKKAEDGSEGEAAGDGAADAPKEAEGAAAAEAEEGGGHRRRRRHKEKDQDKDRSKSPEAEEGQKKEKKRRRRSGERGRRHKGDAEGAAAADESRDEPPKQDGEDAPASPAAAP